MADDVGACDVLVLGAGAAGIGAARRLLEENDRKLRVIVLEARDRVGGRAWASDELQCGTVLDHGGRWVHGSTSTDPQNPMTELARRHQISTTIWGDYLEEMGRKKNITRVVLQSNGETIMQSTVPTDRADRAAKLLFNQLCKPGKTSTLVPVRHELPFDASYKDGIEELANRELPGKPFKEWLEAKAMSALRDSGHSDEISERLMRETIALLRHRIYNWMENYEGCRLDQCSLRHTYDGTILPGPNAHVAGGYGKLIETLAAEIDVRFGHRVKSADRSNSQGVEVVCTRTDDPESKKRFVARMGCIVALPLGVLQRRDPVFDPPLPERLVGAIDRLGMCLMNKIEVTFPCKWWPDGTGTLNIASENADADEDFPLGNMPWSQWIVEGDSPPILVCYATGVFAERIETMANEDIQREAMEALRSAFLDDKEDIPCIPDAVRIHVTRWRSDPFARGSWTYFKAGTRGTKDVRAFSKYNSKKDSSDKLFFAGEHTCDGRPGLDIGTIHGAFSSGRLELQRQRQREGAATANNAPTDPRRRACLLAAPLPRQLTSCL